jgi:hypothetical protein
MKCRACRSTGPEDEADAARCYREPLAEDVAFVAARFVVRPAEVAARFAVPAVARVAFFAAPVVRLAAVDADRVEPDRDDFGRVEADRVLAARADFAGLFFALLAAVRVVPWRLFAEPDLVEPFRDAEAFGLLFVLMIREMRSWATLTPVCAMPVMPSPTRSTTPAMVPITELPGGVSGACGCGSRGAVAFASASARPRSASAERLNALRTLGKNSSCSSCT